ncbi:5-oxoprolinase subunit PxpB [Mangrovicella endophytica]|uniref:5-oxoprolinase subunit PxpB n=1 Tax=Mangrovicella endophytica TaxID=2066697 RepID=UPI000C9DE979|nr:5-oxoprolinase subunit PxpB [Mangrovicella endophytica]
MEDMPRFLDAGDCGLVVEFGTTIDAAINADVMALDAAIAAANLDGVRETIPTYRSILVIFEPLILRRSVLKQHIADLVQRGLDADALPRRGWIVPVLYGGAAGEDLETVAALHEITTEEVIRLHSGAQYRVYMIGFSPGFAYLGGLPEALHTSRRTTPRMKTPPRSISIGGGQAAVSPPLELPSGWHLLGRTPVRSYDPGRGERTFLFGSGDIIRFEPVAEAEYDRLCRAAEAGDLVTQPFDL